MLLGFGKQKYRKRTLHDDFRLKEIYKPKDGKNLKEWDRVKICDIQEKEFTKTAKQR
jgi:hypothetical protein